MDLRGRTAHQGGWLAGALAVVVSLAAAGCSAGPPGDGSPSAPGSSPESSPGLSPGSAASAAPDGSSAPPADIAAATALLDATDPSDEASVSALQEIRFTDAGTTAARTAIEGGATGDALWAATWVYASAATDPEPLLAPIASDDSSTRVIAAAGLVSLGRPEGFDVLLAALGSGDALAGSHPPLTVAGFAAHTLVRYTGVDPGAGPSATPAESAAAWTAWFETNRGDLAFDPAAGTWSAR